MDFVNPGALWWLLPLGGGILLLYLLKMRRKDLKVPATFLWPPFRSEVRANALFQRLRFNWLLVLQLLAILLILFALAYPQVRREGLAGEVTVFVVDTSASMSAVDASGSRFEAAKRFLHQALGNARPGDRVSVIEAGPIPRVVAPLSGDMGKIRAALRDLQATDCEADIGEALRLGAALVGDLESARIVLLSDGAFPEIEDFSPGKAKVVFQRIGVSGENAGIIALGAAETPSGKQVYCGVTNFGTKYVTGTLSLHAGGRLFDSRKVEIPPGETLGVNVAAPRGAKIVEAFLETDDLLAADNYAAAVTDPSASIRVLLVSSGNIFLERALALDPRVTLDRAASLPETERAGSLGQSAYDIVVFDGVAEKRVKARGVLSFGVAGSPSPVTVSGSVKNPLFIDADAEHALMRFVDMRDTYVAESEQASPKPQGVVLAESSAGPLIVAADTDKRQIYVSFKLLESDFPLQVGFPIFIANVLDYLAGEGSADVFSIPTGKPFSVPAPPGVDSARLKTPDGTTLKLEAAGGRFVAHNLLKAGRYELRVGDRKQTLYASLLNERESNVQPVAELRLGGGEVSATSAGFRLADFWRPLLLLALLVLGVEWWVFARRS
ncbi:MAG: VWA domain-containing protein [Armatimonadetes bacterium]|nr:VWA domain-containing protein [Armatimonadota bacterium]